MAFVADAGRPLVKTNHYDPHLEERVQQRLLAAQSRWGRFCLNAYVQWKRLSWRLVTKFAYGLKRAFDLVFSLAALILLTPLLLVIAALVKLDGGPVFLRQPRHGLHGIRFRMWKFRSMVPDAEARQSELLAQNEKAEGVTFKLKNDPRVTRVGRFLRKTSFDELPQLINVLKGDMSLVGPRPPLAREVELYTQQHRRRFHVKPGMTGLWQVGERAGGVWEIGDRNTIDFEEQVGLDVRYIESQSFWRDVWLLCKTVPVILFGKGA